MQADIDEIIAGMPPLEEPLSVYHELDNTFFSVTSDTFIGQVYNRLGLRNIADEAEGTGGAYPQLNAEFIISTNPDLIFLADTKCCGESAETVAARPGWGSIAAVANGGVVEMDDDIASRWGPRLVDYMQAVADAVQRVAVGVVNTPAVAVAAPAVPVAPRRDWWIPVSVAILLGALVLGAMIGPAGPDWWRVPLALLDRLPLIAVDSGVSDAEWNIDLAHPDAPGRARRRRRGDALARRRELPGRVPQPARRPVPARGGGRRRARGDDRVHGRPLGDGRLAGRPGAHGGVRGRLVDGARHLHRRCRVRRHPVRA